MITHIHNVRVANSQIQRNAILFRIRDIESYAAIRLKKERLS
jgi:hypothetical protein